jgi:hypothetical protein
LNFSDKLLSGTLFKLNVMDEFRKCGDNVDYNSVSVEIKDAWFSFIHDFCPLVSYEWNEYLNNVMNIETASFLGSLTVSDETFAEWTIRCKYDEAVADTEEIKRQGKESWMQTRKKRKRGPHDSREKLSDYSQLYQKIHDHRKNNNGNKQWQQMFFQSYFHDNEEMAHKHDHVDEDVNSSNVLYRIPGMDGELDGFDDNEVIPFPI